MTPVLAHAQAVNGSSGGRSAAPADGIYRGHAQLVGDNDAGCQPGSDVALEVHDGRMKLPWTDRQFFDARIAGDGSFAASTIPAVQAEKHMVLDPTLAGRIGTDGVTADYGTRLCRYRLVATRSIDGQHLSARTDGPGLQK